MTTQFYQRTVDAGHGTQTVEVTNGTITGQWISPNQGGEYTGDGNPELVSQPKRAMHGYGFRKVSKARNDQMLEDSVSHLL